MIPATPGNSPPEAFDTSAEADKRLTELEIKASFAEDLLEELNQVIVRQQQQIDALLRETRQLRLLLPDTNAAGMAAGRAADDLPPHY
ncbi:MAG: SlyX family protein [Comamonadaceae bacterium]|nr:MAG: SlyX family protein [Comamonadaceae bacterium]